MNPMITSTLGILFALIGLTACSLMWELKGRATPPVAAHKLVRYHRVLGRLFIIVLALMVVGMVRKVSGYQEELSPRALVHTALAMVLLALAVAKVWVAKRLPNLTNQLFWLGTGMFTLAVALVAITAGHYLLYHQDLRYVTVDEQSELALDAELGRQLLFRKCNKCHTFERILLSIKDRQGWEETVNRMATYDAPNITPFDIRQITHALFAWQRERQEVPADTSLAAVGKSLVRGRCSRCHELERIYAARKTAEEWTATVSRMIGYAGDPPLVSDTEREAIMRFLVEKEPPL